MDALENGPPGILYEDICLDQIQSIIIIDDNSPLFIYVFLINIGLDYNISGYEVKRSTK